MPNIEFDVDHVAKLANLELSDDERAHFSEDLPSIVAYVSKLHEVETEGVAANAYLMKERNVFRADEVESSSNDTQQALVKEFPKSTGDMLDVPGVFE